MDSILLGPVIGSAVKALLESGSRIQTAIEFGSIRILYLISAIGIILLQLAFGIPETQKSFQNNFPYFPYTKPV